MMNDKVELSFCLEQKHSEVEICGQIIDVVDRISYADKREFASEYAARICVIDQENEIAYEAQDVDLVMDYLLCKYYTNIDVEKYDEEIERLHDLVQICRDKLFEICYDDFCIAQKLADRYIEKTIDIYNTQHSLGHKAKMGFAGLLNGGDIFSQISESKMINEELINLLEKARKQDEAEKDQSVIIFPWAAKKEE